MGIISTIKSAFSPSKTSTSQQTSSSSPTTSGNVSSSGSSNPVAGAFGSAPSSPVSGAFRSTPTSSTGTYNTSTGTYTSPSGVTQSRSSSYVPSGTRIVSGGGSSSPQSILPKPAPLVPQSSETKSTQTGYNPATGESQLVNPNAQTKAQLTSKIPDTTSSISGNIQQGQYKGSTFGQALSSSGSALIYDLKTFFGGRSTGNKEYKSIIEPFKYIGTSNYYSPATTSQYEKAFNMEPKTWTPTGSGTQIGGFYGKPSITQGELQSLTPKDIGVDYRYKGEKVISGVKTVGVTGGIVAGSILAPELTAGTLIFTGLAQSAKAKTPQEEQAAGYNVLAGVGGIAGRMYSLGKVGGEIDQAALERLYQTRTTISGVSLEPATSSNYLLVARGERSIGVASQEFKLVQPVYKTGENTFGLTRGTMQIETRYVPYSWQGIKDETIKSIGKVNIGGRIQGSGEYLPRVITTSEMGKTAVNFPEGTTGSYGSAYFYDKSGKISQFNFGGTTKEVNGFYQIASGRFTTKGDYAGMTVKLESTGTLKKEIIPTKIFEPQFEIGKRFYSTPQGMSIEYKPLTNVQETKTISPFATQSITEASNLRTINLKQFNIPTTTFQYNVQETSTRQSPLLIDTSAISTKSKYTNAITETYIQPTTTSSTRNFITTAITPAITTTQTTTSITTTPGIVTPIAPPTGFTYPTNIPPVIIPSISSPGFDFSNLGTRTFKGKRKLGYSPDFKSIFFGIKGKAPRRSSLTGYGEVARPIVGGSPVKSFLSGMDNRIKNNFKVKAGNFIKGFKRRKR